MRWLEGIINSMDMSLSNLREIVKDREVWSAAVHLVTKSWTQLSDWATITMYNWITVLHSSNYHYIINQLYFYFFNVPKLKKKKRAEGRGSCQHSLEGVFSRKRTKAGVPEVWRENENRARGSQRSRQRTAKSHGRVLTEDRCHLSPIFERSPRPQCGCGGWLIRCQEWKATANSRWAKMLA